MAKLRDFRRASEKTYKFNISTGEDEDFAAVLSRFKNLVPLRDRRWLQGEKSWEVCASPQVERALARVFENAESCITMVKSQLVMF